MIEPVAEVYKSISGYEGLYQVSNMGNIKSLDRENNIGKHVTSKILKQTQTKDGYMRVQLSKSGITKSFRVHRLVAQAFTPNLDNLPQVNHKDENKENNCVDNLEWCTAEYNTNYGTRNERAFENFDYNARNKNKGFLDGVKNSAKLRSKKIEAIFPDGKTLTFDSIRDAVKALNISESSIIMVLKKRWKHCHGIVFKYTNPLTEAVQLPVEGE